MLNKIKRKSVSESVFEEIKSLIVSGEWSEGTKIPSENKLAEMMGVSRVSVRSALQQLSSLGFIESRQGGGTYVCKLDGGQNLNPLIPFIALDSKNQKYMVEFRRIIESEACYLTALRATDEDIKKLKENTDFYQKEEEKNYMSEVSLELDTEFHMMIMQMTGNPMFTQLSYILKDTIIENIRYTWAHTKINNAIKPHQQIIHCIEQRDPVSAREAMWDHMDFVWNLIKNAKD